MQGRLVKVTKIVSGTINQRGQTAPAVVEYDFAIRLRPVEVPNSQARKLSFIPIDSSRKGELPLTVFVLGDTDPVSPFLESAFDRKEFDTAP